MTTVPGLHGITDRNYELYHFYAFPFLVVTIPVYIPNVGELPHSFLVIVNTLTHILILTIVILAS